jgi:glycosyltransferase involved in cell wall biosynthesis|tara:strand:+ start:11993 stop:13423 length:1431 start_codon:yes stop_codon:yes gene_type:complete
MDTVSVVMIDWRNNQWVQEAIESVNSQSLKPKEFIIVKNHDNDLTIGAGWNKGVKQATADWVLFIGDDDKISQDYLHSLLATLDRAIEKGVKNPVCVTSYLTAFTATGAGPIPGRMPTGMWKREFLLEHPFDESLKRLVDAKYINKHIHDEDNGDLVCAVHQYGYFYRQHENKTSAHINVTDKDDLVSSGEGDKKLVIYDRIGSFTDALSAKYLPDFKIIKAAGFRKETYDWADTAFFEWCDQNLIAGTAAAKNGTKIVTRLHSYEAFTNMPDQVNWNKVDKVIFVAPHIRDFVLKRTPIDQSKTVVIPNGIDIDKYSLWTGERNKKIAYAGYLAQKKGVQLLMFLARCLPDYEFHVAGAIQEMDIEQYLEHIKPDNVVTYPWQTDMSNFYQDKSFVLNCSPRESQSMATMEAMACGLKPLVHDWVGAGEIYGKTWKSLDDLKELLDEPLTPKRYRRFVKERYSQNEMVNQIRRIL